MKSVLTAALLATFAMIGAAEAHGPVRQKLELEQTLILLNQCVLGLGQNGNQRFFIQIGQRGNDRQATDKLRD